MTNYSKYGDIEENVVKAVCKEVLAVKDAKIISNPILTDKTSYDLWLCWSVDVNMYEAASKGSNYMRDKLLDQLMEIGNKITVYEVNQAREQLATASKEIEELKKKVEELTPYKHFAEVSKEINGVKGTQNAK